MHSTGVPKLRDASISTPHPADMSGLVTSILDLILGRACAGCDEPGALLCSDCARALEPRIRRRLDVDMGDVMDGLRIPVVCAMDYRGPARQVLYRYKDHRIRQLAQALGPPLAASIGYAADITGAPLHRTLLTPMPTRKSSLRRRGFDATAQLAKQAHKLCRAAGVQPLLKDVRSAGMNKTAGAWEREQRTIDAFRILHDHDLPSAPVIVIDDVVTTGATVKEAVGTLVLAGVQVIAVATVAGTP